MAGTSVTRISSGDKPSSVLLIWHKHDLAVGYALEVLPVGALAVAFHGLHELLARDPAVLVGDISSTIAMGRPYARCTVRTPPPINELSPTQTHKLMEEQSVSGSAQTTLPSALTLLGFCAPDRIQRNILSN